MSIIPVAKDDLTASYSLDNITGLRFQPLVELSSGRVIAHEVLVDIKGMSPDAFFSALPPEYSLALFFWQAEKILQSHHSEHFWLNLPVAIFLNSLAVTKLTQFDHKKRLTVEIQDPENLRSLNTLEKRMLQASIQKLRKAGWQVWLDDLAFDMEEELLLLSLSVNGVKIDHQEIRRKDRLNQLVTTLKNDFSCPVLVEGIETSADVETVKNTGAEYGQGFFWPELKASITIPSIITEQAEEWRIDTLLANSQRLKIALSCTNTFFKEGLCHLVSSLIHDPFKPDNWMNIALVDDELQADIVFRYCLPGEAPFDCHRFHRENLYQSHVLRTRYVVLYDSEKRYPLSRCPSVSATVTSRQKLVKIKEMLAKLLAYPAGTLNQTPPSVFNAFCRTCSRHTLTVRENEVVISLGKGVSVAAIALRLGITMKNVSHYKRSVMRKMNLTTNVEFYQYAHWFSGEGKKAVTTGNRNG